MFEVEGMIPTNPDKILMTICYSSSLHLHARLVRSKQEPETVLVFKNLMVITLIAIKIDR